MKDLPPVPGLHPEVGLLLAMLEEGTLKWRGQLGAVPDSALIWQPFPEGHSIGAVLLHMADVEASWLDGAIGGRERDPEERERLLSDAIRQYDVRWPRPPERPLAWYFAQQQAVRQRTVALVREGAGPERLGRLGEREVSLRWALAHVIHHEAYHGGQAVLLFLQWLARARSR